MLQRGHAVLLVMRNCMGTSENLVSTLFPKLIYAVEKNKPTMAIRYLEKAKPWITDIIQQVDKIIERYDRHNHDVSTTTSDIITEKRETEKKSNELSTEIKAMEDALEKLNAELKTFNEKVAEIEKQIGNKSQELETHVKSVTSKNKGLGIFASVVPFFEAILNSILNVNTGPGVAEKTRALENELNRLTSEKNSLKMQEWNVQLKVIDEGMKLAQKKIYQGAIPDPVHLGEVQQCLTKIQHILIQLKSFWEKVLAMLESIRDKTFVDEDLVDDPEEKELFISSIQEASKVWKSFGHFCGEATQIFKEQTRDAYKFLETDPSSLSTEVWKQQYDSVTEQLKNINVCKSSDVPAINNRMEKVGLGVHDGPPPPSAVQSERTPEVALDAVFSARLLGNETPEPEHEQVSSEDEEETLFGYPKDSKILRFFMKTAEELVRWLESTFHPQFPVWFLYEHLVGRLMEEVKMLPWINITFEASDAQLFPDEDDAVSYIISEVHEDLLNKSWRMELSCFNEGLLYYITYAVMNAFINYTMFCCKAARTSPDTDLEEEGSQGEPEMQELCSTALSQRSPSKCEELIRELGGSSDSSDECSETLTGFQTYKDRLVKIPIRSLMTASEDPEVENPEDLEVPACANGEYYRFHHNQNKVEEAPFSYLQLRETSLPLRMRPI
ncbi:hypothetical protein SRHO_G00075530 [Serrasalmus rhombeus]